MKRLRYLYIISASLMLVFLTFSCQKDKPLCEEEEIRDIELRVVTPESMGESRAEVTNESLKNITLFGLSNNQSVFAPEASIVVSRPQTGRIWKPEKPGEPGVYYQWTNNITYDFHAYAYTEVDAAHNASIAINDMGRKVAIKQPDAYATREKEENGKKVSTSTTTDYLLSYKYSYDSKPPHRIIPIYLEHALCKVNLYITRASSMTNNQMNKVEVDITNLKVAFSNLVNETVMTCNKQQKLDFENQVRNDWSFAHATSTANYILELKTAQETNDLIKDETQTRLPVMSFIAIPVNNTGMADYQLSLEYDVVTTETDGVKTTTSHYDKSYILPEVTQQWASGHEINYSFLIDNGIHLSASIKKWIDVDYIEGTILPPLPLPEEGNKQPGKTAHN